MEKGFRAWQTRSSVPWRLGTGPQPQARGREASRGSGPASHKEGTRGEISQAVPRG